MLALIVQGSAAALAQSPPQLSEPPRVYVVDFATTGSDPHFANLSSFTPDLIRLQLLEMPVLEVVRTASAPPCGEANRSSGQTQVAPNTGAHVPNDFFLITGSIAFRSADIQINGSLDKCKDKKLVPVTSDQALFVPGRALEQITILTQFLVYKLEAMLPATQVRIAAIRSPNKKLDTVAAQLTEQIKLEMTQHPGFQVSDAPATTVVIEGDLSRRTGGVLDANVRIRWGEDVKPLPTTSGRADNVPAFLRDTGKFVFDMLSSEVIGERFGSTDYLETALPEKLVEDGKRLLCRDQAPTCKQDPQAALRLLTAAAGRSSPADPKTLYLLGLAQSAALGFPEAIATLTRVVEISDSAGTPDSAKLAIQALNAMASVYNQAGDTPKAATSYAKSLQRDPSQSAIYIRQSDTLLATDPLGAINVLLDGLRHDPQSKSIHPVLQSDVLKLKPADFAAVTDLLRSAMGSLPVSDEYAQACAYAASQLLYTDLPRAKQYLSRTDGLRSVDLSPVTRNWIARLRAVGALQENNYETAFAYAQQAQSIVDDEKFDDQKMSTALLSKIQVAWAQSLKKGDPERARMLNQAYDRVKPLALAGDDQGYQSFMEVNHLLHRDAESKQVFFNLLNKNVDDHYAARGVLFVCEEYLLDADCAYKAADQALKNPSDDIDLQLDGVEAAVLFNQNKKALEWLTIVEQHAEADSMSKAIAGFYRFWISYAENSSSSKQDFQHLLTSLDEYHHVVTAASSGSVDKWSFLGARHILNENKLPAATNLPEQKKQVLLVIMDAFDHPEKGTAGLTRLAEQM